MIHARFGEDRPMLFDRDDAPKPAYFGVRDALAAGRQVAAQPVTARRRAV